MSNIGNVVTQCELKQLCEPVASWLRENCNPHCTVIITGSHAKLVSEEMGVPMEQQSGHPED